MNINVETNFVIAKFQPKSSLAQQKMHTIKEIQIRCFTVPKSPVLTILCLVFGFSNPVPVTWEE